MMAYKVVYTKPFLTDIQEHIDYLRGQGASNATIQTWYDVLFTRLDRLDEMPKRLPVDEVMTGFAGSEIRKMNYSEYLVFYRVDDTARRVEILRFEHGARRRRPIIS